MDTLNCLQKLLIDENGLSKYWNNSSPFEQNLDLEGELFLLKAAEDLLFNSSESFNHNSIICKCKSALPKCQAVIDSIWEKLNTGVWKDVPHYLRRIYSHASLIKSFALYNIFCFGDNSKKSDDYLKSALKSIDLGILLGVPTSELTVAAQLVSQEISKLKYAEESGDVSNAISPKKIRLEGAQPNIIAEESTSNIGNSTRKELTTDTPWRKWKRPRQIPALDRPSLERFSKENFKPRRPVILKGCLHHWPALSSWSPSYLAQIAGERTVPIELGPHYVHPAWGQKLMAVSEFVNHHLLNESNTASEYDQIGYLAQHPLFEQVPALRADIKVPEYCCLTDSCESDDNEEEEPVINAWFGPKGTVSPLHYDPKHNLLAQVVGRKRVILYANEDSSHLHPYEGQLLDNTSQVDPEDPKTIERFPDVSLAEPWECEIQSGDMLYIPPKWWHHVRSLSTSFSVSFWWQ